MTTLEKLKNEIAETVTISDFVLASLYKIFADDAGVHHLKKSNRLFHEIFHELKKNPRFSSDPILQSLVFDDSLPIPYSEEIDTALFRIETAHILETENPSYQGYSVKPEDIKYVKNAFSKLQANGSDIEGISEFVRTQITNPA